MAEEIGRGVIRIEGDASGFKTATNEAKRSIKDLGDATGKAATGTGKMGAGAAKSEKQIAIATRNMISSIERTTAAMDAGSRTSSKYYETIAKQRGVSVDALKPYLAQLDAVNAKQELAATALNKGSIAFNKHGLSAKQMAANLRGVPAQFTDIAVSLQAGQNPLTVFLQQGGQLKDMFGGIGPAAKALGGYVLGLVNPFTIAAAAVGALTLAYYKGSKEQDAYNKALIMTGNIAGTTANQLAGMAQSIDKSSSSVTQGAAAEALAELAGTGEIAAANLEKFAKVALNLQKRVGIPIKDTAKDLAELGKAPLEASDKLNEKYNYLTASVREQIKALEDQGRAEEAAALAQNTYANEFDARAKNIEANLGFIERAWGGVKSAAKEAWDEFLGIGRKDTLQERLADVTNRIGRYGNRNFPSDQKGSKRHQELLAEQESIQAQIAAESKLANAKTESNKQEQAKIQFQKEGEKFLSKQIKLEKEIARARVVGKAAGASQAEIEARVKNIIAESANKPTKTKKDNEPARIAAAQLAADLDGIKKAASEVTDTYGNAEKIMAAQRAAGLIDEREYYQAKLGFLTLNSNAQETAIRMEIARLEREKLSGKEKIDNDRKIADAKSRLGKVQADTAANLELLSIQEAGSNKRIAESYENARIAAQAYIDTVNKQNAREIAGVGKGAKFRGEQLGKNAIEDKQTGQRQGLERDLRNDKITKDQFDKYLAIVNKTYADEIAAYESRTATLNAMQGDWVNGATEALANYYDQTRNVAGQMEDLFTKAFKGMEDALTSFVMTGKADFKSLANSIIADMVRMVIQKQITAPLAEAANSLIGSMFAGTGSANGNAFDASGTKLSGFAAGGVASGPTSGYPVLMHGTEAILPLKRGASGRLGVEGGGGAVTVNVINNASGTQARTQERQENGVRIIDVMVEQVEGAIGRRMSRGEGLAPTMERRYGLNPSAGAMR